MEITTLKNPYIYKVTNFVTGQYYIGSQCRGLTLGVNYFTSSHNKEFKDGFKTYGEEKYKIEIIKEFEDPDECVRAENYMISDHMQLKDGLCLNRACHCNGEKIFSTVGTHHSEETRKRISASKKGKPHPHKGIHPSEEIKQKLSATMKGRPAQNRIKISIEGGVFSSITEASKYYNVAIETIRYWIKKNQHNAVYIK